MAAAPQPAIGRAKRLLLAIGMPVLLIGLVVAALPLWLPGLAAGWVEDAFAEQRHGRLELADLDLSWTGAQAVHGGRLLDPDGAEVARFEAELPSLWSLARGGGRRIGRVHVTLSADLVADDAGQTNLQRALAERGVARPKRPDREGGGGEDEAGGLGELELDLELRVPRITWSDASTRVVGEPLALEDVALDARVVPGQPLLIDLTGRVLSEQTGDLRLRASVDDPGAAAPRVDLECDIDGLPTGLVDGLAGLGGILPEHLGPTLDLHGGGSGTVTAAQFDLRFQSRSARAELRLELAHGVLAVEGGVSADVPATRIAQWLDPSLPAGVRVERLGGELFEAEVALGISEFGDWLADTSSPLPPVSLRVDDLRLGDWRVSAGESEREWNALRATLAVEADRSGSLTLASAGPAPLKLTVRLRGTEDSNLPGIGGGMLHVPGVPTALLDEIAGLDGRLERLAGKALELHVSLPDSETAPSLVALELLAPSLELRARARFADGVLAMPRGAEYGSLEVLHRSPATLVAEFAPGFELAEPLGELRLDVRELELPLEAWLDGELDPTGLLLSTSADFGLSLQALEFEHVLPDGTSVPVTLERLVLDVDLFAGAARASLNTGVQDSNGVVSAQLEAGDLTGLVADPVVPPPVIVTAKAEALPSLLVDLLAEQNGLVVDMLGPELSLDARGHWPAAGQPYEINLRSTQATLDLTGGIEEGFAVAGEGDALDATAPLGPLFSDRVVGKLVPILMGIAKPPDAKPVALRVEHYRFPLDGDMSKLDCDVVLDLGEVSYQLLPGLQDSLASFGTHESRRRTSTIAPITIAVRGGVASYDKLPLQIEGVTYLFGGTYDLAAGTLELATNIPLSKLGRGVAGQLEKVRDIIDTDTQVPILIRGTFTRPSIHLGDGFLEKLVPKTAERILEKGVLDLFERQREKREEKERKDAEKKARKQAEREAEEPESSGV